MAKEILVIPEASLADVILVIRMGLAYEGEHISNETREQLTKWCDAEEAYINSEGG